MHGKPKDSPLIHPRQFRMRLVDTLIRITEDDTFARIHTRSLFLFSRNPYQLVVRYLLVKLAFCAFEWLRTHTYFPTTCPQHGCNMEIDHINLFCHLLLLLTVCFSLIIILISYNFPYTVNARGVEKQNDWTMWKTSKWLAVEGEWHKRKRIRRRVVSIQFRSGVFITMITELLYAYYLHSK